MSQQITPVRSGPGIPSKPLEENPGSTVVGSASLRKPPAKPLLPAGKHPVLQDEGCTQYLPGSIWDIVPLPHPLETWPFRASLGVDCIQKPPARTWEPGPETLTLPGLGPQPPKTLVSECHPLKKCLLTDQIDLSWKPFGKPYPNLLLTLVPRENPESPDPLRVPSLKTLLPVEIPQPGPGASL